ncbi:hypothetical protein ACFQ1E_08930 [Sphingomonas canadensis]|uniref:Heme exporter protein D n=1 Tax=Sphingomonas canadensis TaxID=1219257 RepID=A0ABW3H8I7_9SPHN|nr:hypothetical protein [Sphingomonas canadensis]MCW3836163.1 hypothetical protein [Sphingomonas canadensis]
MEPRLIAGYALVGLTVFCVAAVLFTLWMRARIERKIQLGHGKPRRSDRWPWPR